MKTVNFNARNQRSGFTLLFSGLTGSRLYGTARKDSDTDIRGVFVPPAKYFLGWLNRCEQLDKTACEFKGFDNPPDDLILWNLVKFMRLAVGGNPNITEVLFIPEKFWFSSSSEWIRVIKNRKYFLSLRARDSFAGYAVSQFNRIKSHNKWLRNQVKKKPERPDFGLKENSSFSKEFLGFILNNLKENDNPDSEMMQLIDRERRYHQALRDWEAYQRWKKERNPARAKLEEKYGYDTKNALHLFRLISEGEELLTTGHITFPRPDAEYLLSIRNGALTFDQVLEAVDNIDKRFDALTEKSVLPKEPSREILDRLCIDTVGSCLYREMSEWL